MNKKLMKDFEKETGKIIDYPHLIENLIEYVEWLENRPTIQSNKYDAIIGIVDSVKYTKHPHLVGKAGEMIESFIKELEK